MFDFSRLQYTCPGSVVGSFLPLAVGQDTSREQAEQLDSAASELRATLAQQLENVETLEGGSVDRINAWEPPWDACWMDFGVCQLLSKSKRTSLKGGTTRVSVRRQSVPPIDDAIIFLICSYSFSPTTKVDSTQALPATKPLEQHHLDLK